MSAHLTIVVVERDHERAMMIMDALREAGEDRVHVLGDETGLARRVAELQPDLVLIDLASPSRDILEELALATGPTERPVAMFVDRSDSGLTRAAIEAGVSAYVVDGLRAERIRPILDAAIARFHLFSRMRSELAATRAALEERKVVDRAKGFVMRAKGLNEEQAYGLLRKTAMDQGKRLAEVAQAVVTAAEILK
ncbi:MAG: two-component system response regulator [Cereibacter sphaeroides]|uniref:Two-component system response regulator n=1 Tax=Cereibacter sphaeroides TaxID=1063 RepID=A0A2W5UIW3_CERSP|nr:MAG: two-component system response regulator [Cereibacter sphaeroides]